MLNLHLNEQFASQLVGIAAALTVIGIVVALLIWRDTRRVKRAMEELEHQITFSVIRQEQVANLKALLSQTIQDLERKSQPPIPSYADMLRPAPRLPYQDAVARYDEEFVRQAAVARQQAMAAFERKAEQPVSIRWAKSGEGTVVAASFGLRYRDRLAQAQMHATDPVSEFQSERDIHGAAYLARDRS